MGTEDKRRQFDEIVAHLTADYPSLVRTPGQVWPRTVLIAAMVIGAVAWALLSVAMVAWGWKGVVLTCTVVPVAILAAVIATHRRLRGHDRPA
jgi:hypothetical protein